MTVVQVNFYGYEGGLNGEEGIFRGRPSGCVCKAKRPAVGAHLLTISPWRVVLHTEAIYTLFFGGRGFPSADEEWQLYRRLKLLNREMFHEDKTIDFATHILSNYKFNCKRLLSNANFC